MSFCLQDICIIWNSPVDGTGVPYLSIVFPAWLGTALFSFLLLKPLLNLTNNKPLKNIAFPYLLAVPIYPGHRYILCIAFMLIK